MTRRTRMIVAAVLAVALMVPAVWFGFFRDRSPDSGPKVSLGDGEVALLPRKADATGVDPATGFTLTSAKSMKAEAVAALLTVQPHVDLRVAQTDRDGKEFTVTPAQALEANRVYRFRLAAKELVSRPYQWSFQTQAHFRVLGSLPRNEGQGVPVKTGIELTFTHENYGDVAPFFTITPAVEGRFERHKKTVAFVPANPLKYGTVYTVKLKAGLPLEGSEAKLTADYTFAFETEAAPGTQAGLNSLSTAADLVEFAASDVPYFQLWYGKGKPASAIDVNVYRYGDAAGFISVLQQLGEIPSWASYSRNSYQEDVGKLNRVASFQAELTEYAGGGTYVLFPEALAPGYYMAAFKLGTAPEVRVRFQVSDLASFVTVASNQTLVWLNDLSTKAPVQGAEVRFADGGAKATTGADGVAVLPTPEDSKEGGYYLTARSGGREAVVIATQDRYRYYYGYYGGEPTVASLYWRYLYLDRQLYKPDDQVNIWGVLQPREQGAAPISTITAEVIRGDYIGPDGKALALASTTLQVENGSFIGAVNLPGLRPGWYDLQLRAGDEILGSRWFEVQTYTKPAYQLTLERTPRALFTGETGQVTVQASFFEGTPVPNLRLQYYSGWGGGKDGGREVVTDELGRATISFTPPHETNSDHWGGSNWTPFGVRAVLPEAGEIVAETYFQVFPRTITMDAGVKVSGDGEAEITAQVNLVDLTAMNADPTVWEYQGGPAANRPVRGTVVELNWIKRERGEHYDFISKQVVKEYSYEPAHKEIGTFTATTDGTGAVSYQLPVEPTKAYEVRLQAQDANGHWMQRQLNFRGKAYENPDYQGYVWNRLEPEVSGKYQYGLGETAGFVFRQNEEPAPERSSGYLFLTARMGLQSYQVQDSPAFRTQLTEQDLPNKYILGVRFDGRTYVRTEAVEVRFNPAERQLKVAVQADKTSYRPGDTVNLTVQVLDPRGRPVRSQVNLNLVDEALYALQDQNVDLLGSLYGDSVASGIKLTRSSHNLPQSPGGAEKGGEGGGVRKEFKDAVFFTTVTTGADGKASASFQVPDNLTTWRLTYQALVPDTMAAGSGTVGIEVKLPFFVDVVFSPTYLTGDRPVLIARSFGTALRTGQTVSYVAKLSDGTELKATGRAFAPAAIELPTNLAAGSHTVTVSAAADGGLQDSVEHRFAVTESYLRLNQTDFFLLAPETRVKGADKGLTMLTFSDYERSRYLELVQRLRWQWGNRLEQKLARSLAEGLLEEHFGKLETPGRDEPEVDTFAYQTPEGAIAILPYSDGDLHLSALAADAALERFDRAALELYFTRILDNPETGREQAVIALYGMAALDRPVLSTVQGQLLEQDLTLTEQLYLNLALATLGDLEGARPLYRTLVAAAGEQVGGDMRIKDGRDQDEILSRTALAAMLAAKLGEPEAPALVGYLMTNSGKDVLLSLEQVVIAQDGLSTLRGKKVTFTYVLDGKESKVELLPGEDFSLAVAPGNLSGLRFKNIEGTVGMTAAYDGPLDPSKVAQQQGFRLTRAYSVVGQGGARELRAGDLVRITIDYAIPGSSPDGSYEVVDYLPAGLRMVERPWQMGVSFTGKNDPAWPIEVNGQRVTFWASKEAKYPITYYARVVTPGTYTAEQPAIAHTRSGEIYFLGKREQVIIR